MDGMESSVVLVVKAPNQQIEDQTVHCELGWSIRRLKNYLSEVYPSKPRSEDQKLIYSGQLLNDSVILKDILRTYEGQKNHTLHLVCSPSSATMKTNQNDSPTMNSSQTESENIRTGNNTQAPESQDGLRQRVGYMYTDARPAWADPRTVWGAQTSWPVPPTYDPAYMAQHMAWMQQAYTQYMTQYMQLMSSGTPIANAGTVLQQAPTNHTPPRDEAPPNNVVANGDNEEDEVRGNRDWLEWFYIISRILVLLSIVYFYSSPLRFVLVSTLGIILYLYHLGFFRQIQGERVDPPAVPQPPPVVEVDNNNIEPTPAPREESPAPPEPDRPSLLALTWSVFSSFFLSLIPEQPNNIL